MVLFLTSISSLSVSVTHSNFIMQAFKIVLIPLRMGEKCQIVDRVGKNLFSH